VLTGIDLENDSDAEECAPAKGKRRGASRKGSRRERKNVLLQVRHAAGTQCCMPAHPS
jgi:hypothetical protein